MGFCFEKTLWCWWSYPSLVCTLPPIDSASVGGMRKFVAQISRMDAIMIGYYMVGHIRTTRISLTCNNKLIMGDMNLRRILMKPCDIFWRTHMRRIRSIAIIVSSRGRFYVHGDEI